MKNGIWDPEMLLLANVCMRMYVRVYIYIVNIDIYTYIYIVNIDIYIHIYIL